MPRRARPGNWAIIYAEVHPYYKEKLEAAARENQRSSTGELVMMLREKFGPAPEPEPAKKGKAKKGGGK